MDIKRCNKVKINSEKSELFKTIINIFDKFVIHAGRCFYPGFVPYFSLKRFYDLNSKKFVYTKSLFKEFYKFLTLEFGKIFFILIKKQLFSNILI